MILNSIYEFNSYKEYLSRWIRSQPKNGRGLHKDLAEAARCNPTYLSHVLKGDAHLSLEQAQHISTRIAHNKDESWFFLLLVQYSRAGSQPLRKALRSQLDDFVLKQQDLTRTLVQKDKLDEEDHAIYYSAWYYPAIHVVLSMPRFQTVPELTDYFRLPVTVVQEVLYFLTSRGLAKKEGEKYLVGKVRVHIGKDSAHLIRHHQNLRQKISEQIIRKNNNDLNYSSIVTMAASDMPKVRAVLMKAVEEVRTIIRDSKEDAVYGFACDFFEMK
jgi:uncharacterized protein (TIGR02147 family)